MNELQNVTTSTTKAIKTSEIISHPILHDIIKAHLVYDAKTCLLFCSTLPQIKRSRIFLPESPHHFIDSKQEWFVDGIKYPADAVWRFAATGFSFPSYYIIHEIKTGNYDLKEEMFKHYIHHNHVSLYLWAYKKYHSQNKKVPYSFVKQFDILSLKKYISFNTKKVLETWLEGN